MNGAFGDDTLPYVLPGLSRSLDSPLTSREPKDPRWSLISIAGWLPTPLTSEAYSLPLSPYRKYKFDAGEFQASKQVID